MREIIIHNDSRLIYTTTQEEFMYVCEQHELALILTEHTSINAVQAQQQGDTLLILEKHKLYSFQIPAHGCILLTNISFISENQLVQFYQHHFHHEEIQAHCLWIANAHKSKDEKSRLLMDSYRSRLGFLILNYYTFQSDVTLNQTSSVQEDRILSIQQIIKAHLQDTFTLVDLADALHFTPQYVSLLVKNCFGCSFTRYVSKLRLYEAMEDIQHTSLSFLQIAMKQGFPNVRSFQSAFQDSFHCSPKAYRKAMQQRVSFEMEVDSFPYKEFIRTQMKRVSIPNRDEHEEHVQVSLSCKQKPIPLMHTWRNLMCVGRARLLLVDDIRKQIMEIQRELSFKNIRFHGIFNDDMHVYDEDEKGTPIFHFQQVNDALDFLMSVGLKPFVELGFMPMKLAKHKEMTILDGMFHVSSPKDIELWQALIRAFLKNCINRYGLDEVQTWYFEFWNNGGLVANNIEHAEKRTSLFWQESVEAYLQFYEATYKALKSIHPKLRIGGPAVDVTIVRSFKEHMHAYIRFMKQHHCMIDFLTLHMYPYTDVNSVSETMQDIHTWMKKQKLDMEVHISEWSTWGMVEAEHFNDSCRKANYILKGILDSLDGYNSLGYWTFSDYTETMKTKKQAIFNDNVGLLTNNGIKKAAYNAYVLLRKLGDVQLAKEANYIFTKQYDRYQLLLFSYDDTKQGVAIKNFQIQIEDLPNGTYEKKIYYLNENSGSAYDVWKQMGSQTDVKEEDVVYLKGHSMMAYTRKEIDIANQHDITNECIKENEAVLIEWIYKF